MKKSLAVGAFAALALVWAVPGLSQTSISYTFNDLSSQIIGTGGQRVYGQFDFSITNATGVAWTDFHIFDAEPIGIVDGQSYVGPGSATFDSSTGVFDILGLSIADGGLLSFSLTETCGIAEICSLGGAIWEGNPTTGGVIPAVPEPETYLMLLAGLGLMGFALRRRSHNLPTGFA